jgi:hypothetical protein
MAMEAYQAVAIAVMIAMGFVVNSTLKLTRFRKRIGVKRTLVDLRDLSVFRQPRNFDAEEVRLVRANWIACGALLALVLLMLALIPEELSRRF